MTAPVRDRFVEDRLPPANEQPEFIFGLPELQYPDRLNAAEALLASGSPSNVAVLNDQGKWSYAELDEFSGQIASVLRDRLDLALGNRALLVGPNSMKLFACWLGILKAGGVAVAAMPILRAHELAKIVVKAQVTLAIVHEDCREVVARAAQSVNMDVRLLVFGADQSDCSLRKLATTFDAIPPCDISKDDPALIAFTSGTTGEPKGCVHLHRDILASADTFARHIIKPDIGLKWISSAPLAFTFGLGMQFVFPLRFAGTAVTPSAAGPRGLMQAIEDHKVDICATAPTAYRAMLGCLDEYDLGSLETCVSAGEHLPASTWEAWKKQTGLALIDGIGATEMMHVFISANEAEIRPGSTGRAVPGYIATVLGGDGNPLTVGIGRLAVQGPTGCRYLEDERQQSYVVDGWNITGDTFRRDEDGYFWFVARSDDMIVSSGYNIAGPEVEDALYSHPAVADCAVVGIPCEMRGSLVKAYVVLQKGFEPDEGLVRRLQNHVKREIAPYKYPREIAFVEALPKTATGKVKRYELRSRS